MNRLSKSRFIALAVSGLIGASGCGGGGGGGGSTGTGQLTSGVITGFGSVYVDGIEFETNQSSFSLDDGPGSEDDLEVGMVVTVKGTVDQNGTTGTATHIEYDDELEGIVLSTGIGTDGTGTMDIMGQIVNIGPTTIFESDVPGITGIEQIVAGNVVEVSGYSSGDGTAFATRIEVKLASHAGEEIEVKGIIHNLTASTFGIGGLTVNFSTAMLEDIPGGVLVEGLYVEVKSTQGMNASGQLVASKVELEDDGDMDLDGDDGEDVKLNGIITAELSETVFEIDGQTVIIVADTEFEHGSIVDLAEGVLVKVEGRFNVDDALIAEEIELEEERDIEMEGTLEAVNGTGASGTVTLFGQTIIINSMTILVDDQDEDGLLPVHFFGLDDLAAGDFVELDAFRDSVSGNLVAAKLERDDHSDDVASLEGPVEDIPDGNTLVIAGVTVDVSGVGMPPVSVGDEVEVDGDYDVGTMIFTATAIEVDEEGD
ncbi:MAG: DUF5666 domain-containing protein [Gammaproteobacteria bacterium]|nr:DUF5666 domain-containing protein [Gammaproteobacteria bacterium]